jgi:hypothetical protein
VSHGVIRVRVVRFVATFPLVHKLRVFLFPFLNITNSTSYSSSVFLHFAFAVFGAADVVEVALAVFL